MLRSATITQLVYHQIVSRQKKVQNEEIDRRREREFEKLILCKEDNLLGHIYKLLLQYDTGMEQVKFFMLKWGIILGNNLQWKKHWTRVIYNNLLLAKKLWETGIQCSFAGILY